MKINNYNTFIYNQSFTGVDDEPSSLCEYMKMIFEDDLEDVDIISVGNLGILMNITDESLSCEINEMFSNSTIDDHFINIKSLWNNKLIKHKNKK